MTDFLILAIETSCDDTSVAIINSRYQVLANLISSQHIHQKYGGVVPEIASRMHLQNLMPLMEDCLTAAGKELEDISAVAVSVNPGLIGSLLVGTSFAKGLSYGLNIPLIAVNHMLGHIYANKLTDPNLEPPFLALVVSGGHTELVHFKTNDDFEIVGRTMDDAAGEAFDKVAKLLNLGYPGGPIIDELSQSGNPDFCDFPRALKQKDNFNFSYSGLKTAVMNYLESQDKAFISENLKHIVASVQKAIVEPLVEKTIRYANFNKLNKIVLAGGVSANSLLRDMMTKATGKNKFELYYPELKYCMDNAAMIGAAAVKKYIERDFANLELNPSSTKGTRSV
jgi:N6-L-threonylcarbamoyladenine synthase